MAERREGARSPEADRLWQETSALLAELGVSGTGRLRWDSDLARQFGLDSLGVVELHDRLEHAFGVRLPAAVLERTRTPADWLDAVLDARRAATPTAAAPGHPGIVEEGPEPSQPLRRRPGAPWAEAAGTLVDALAWHADRHPDLVSVRLLGDPGSAPEDLTYGALTSEATACARALLVGGLDPGERVAIMLPTGRAYFVVSMGVLMAGGVPVPIYPPARLSVLEEHLRRQARLLENSGAAVLVTVPEALLAGRLLRARVASLRSVRTPAMLSSTQADIVALPVPAPDDIALIQYTSGSTGDPKGVVLTHRQLLANIRAMGQAAQVDSADVFVSWLPLYHDMGLIGAWHAASLCFGMLLVIMSPLQFLARPASWLEAITEYSGTLSAAPNFAYESCTERVSQAELAGLDLSSWRLAFNGSEPVRASTIERFSARFGPCGFRPEAMCPAYGLAEVGVGVAFTPLGRPPVVNSVSATELEQHGRAVDVAPGSSEALRSVSCGRALPGYALRVADRGGAPLPERRLGRVELRGPSATAGYFANAPATEALWDGDWMDTGDSGYLAEGELFLTGRVKDLVIRAGRNLHPEELEEALTEIPGLRPEAVAVFGVPDPKLGTERLVVAAEVELHGADEEADLRAALSGRSIELVGVAPDSIVLVPPGAILRTASGKIRRGATRDAYRAGTLGRRPAPVPVQLARFARSGLLPGARRLAGGAAGLLYATWAWVLVAVIGGSLWVALLLPLPARTRWRATRSAGRALRGALGISLRVEGAIPPELGPAIVAANHQSFVDGLVLILALTDPVVFVSSTDFERQPVVGTFLRRLGCVFVHRDQPEYVERDLGRLVHLLQRGHRVAVFPEGSMTPGGGIRRLRLGAFSVAARVGCPVVPVGLRGTRAVLRPGSFRPRRGAVEVVIGRPQLATGSDFAAGAALAKRVRQAIGDLVGENQPL